MGLDPGSGRHLRPMRRALLAAVFMLTACTAVAPSPSQTARPSIPVGLEQVADAYLDLADDFNAATCSFNVVLSQSAPVLTDLTKASADYAENLETLARGLDAIAWPSALEADATELIDALAVNQAFAEAMAEADTFDAFIDADDQLIASNITSAAAATQLRADMGLGSAGNPCTT